MNYLEVKKRKCFKAGGQWVTNSHGSFCWNPRTIKVKARGSNPKEKGTSKKGYDYYKATTNLDPDSDEDGLSDSLEIFNAVDNDCDSDTSPVKRMNKAELIDAMAKDANLSKADAKRALETLTSNLYKSLENGDSVQLVGFKQSISVRAARTGRNPQTGATIKVKARHNWVNNPSRKGGKYEGLSASPKNKAELVDAIAKDANLSKADAGKAINTFMAAILKELNNENCVKLIVPIAINKGIREGGKTIGAGTNSKRKRPGRTKYSNITLKRSQAENDENNNENNGTKAIDHNGSRSNTTASKIDSKGDGNGENNATRRGKRKAKKECLKNGGSFWESGDGSYHCMMPLSTAKVGENTNNELYRSKKKKCFKAGGQWVTNSHGSFCWNPTNKVYLKKLADELVN